MKFSPCSFFNRYTDGSKERPLASLKRRAQAAHRRRYTVEPDRPATRQAINPPVSATAAAAAAPATRQPGVDAASQTNHPTPAPPAAADEPDPFNEPLEPALELSAADLAPDILTKRKPSIHEIEEVTSLLGVAIDSSSEKSDDPNAGPRCAICHEFTGIPRTSIGPEAGKIEKMAMLPCGHEFGHYCLLEWLDQEYGQACPMCRSLPVHECGHAVLPALAEGAPPSRKGEGGEWEVGPKCQSCRVEGDAGMRLLKLQWQMEEARGMALVSMRQVPDGWAESRIQREWVRMSERTRRVEGNWREELERSWLVSQRGRSEW
ncbi:hypothetical protein VF21_02623 [Pseudogymnoascus sp. 05NY08]|nr:hypothetical protein VF21_02623 [Pseudogymnoascus sp. 05NY08]